MNRIFHARIVLGQYFMLAIITFLAVYFLWDKRPLLAVFWMLWLVFLIERLIHTTYTVTAGGTLQISHGRFSRLRERPLSDIVSVGQVSSMRVAGYAVVHYVLVRYKDGRHDALMPAGEEEFIRVLRDRLKSGRQFSE